MMELGLVTHAVGGVVQVGGSSPPDAGPTPADAGTAPADAITTADEVGSSSSGDSTNFQVISGGTVF